MNRPERCRGDALRLAGASLPALPTTLTTIPSSVDSEANTEDVAPALSAVERSAWAAFADAGGTA